MTGLEDTFGSDFVEDYEQKIAQRREERRSVTDEVKKEVAHLAVNENKFESGDPRFSMTTENDVEHDVYLMQLPEIEGKSIFGYVNELETGAVTCPLDYMDEWWSCLFNDPEVLKSMNPGEHYIIIGNHDTYENNKGEVKDQISPVRGVLTLEEAKEYAKERLEGDVNDSPSEDTSEDDSEEDDSSDDGFSGFGDEEEEEDDTDDSVSVDEDDVEEVIEALAEKEPEVWEVTEDDSDRVKKLTKVICNKLDMEFDDDAVFEEVSSTALEVIDNHGEEDDEEEDIFG